MNPKKGKLGKIGLEGIMGYPAETSMVDIWLGVSTNSLKF